MPLGTDYASQSCSAARALEVVGERWTLLIVRDCFEGLRRFGELQRHLAIPRAVLSARLGGLVAEGVLAREGTDARPEYVLTAKGRALWPVVHALWTWGEEHVTTTPGRRSWHHEPCGTRLDDHGRCPRCDVVPAGDAVEVHAPTVS